MSYQIELRPYTYDYRNTPKKELHEFYAWYLEQISLRIKELAQEINKTPGYENWKPDHSVESLKRLSEWFIAEKKIRLRTPKEVLYEKQRSVLPIALSATELDDRSLSIASDIDMYFADMMMKQHPKLFWKHELSRKDHIDYGQPVIIGFSDNMPMGVIGGCRVNPHRLVELYNTWSNKAP